jgi:hypothetical protein
MYRRSLTLMDPEDVHQFRLVANAGEPPISTANWQEMWSLIVHLQPARSATLDGDPPRAVLIHGFGGTEVAPGLLADLERLAMTSLQVEVWIDGDDAPKGS